jgi:polar amino acid transport system substrate-binding protein
MRVNTNSQVITAERMQKLSFTQPYISGQDVLFVHKDNQSFQSPADLSGRWVGVCTGCVYEAYLHGTLNIPGEKIDYQIKNAQSVGYYTDTSALADLAAGDGVRLDAALTDPDTVNGAIRSGLPIKQLGGAMDHDFSTVTIDKSSAGDPAPLVRHISAIIQELHRDGTLLNLSQKHYGGDFTTPAAKFDLQTFGQIP